MNKDKQEQSENRHHRTPESGESLYEYKLRKHSHEGIEMRMHHTAHGCLSPCYSAHY